MTREETIKALLVEIDQHESCIIALENRVMELSNLQFVEARKWAKELIP